MLTYEQLRNLQLAQLPTGEIVASCDEFETFELVFSPRSVHGEYVNVLAASIFMFNTLEEIRPGLEALIELLELSGKDQTAKPVVDYVAAMAICRQAVIDGLPATAQRIRKK